MHHNNLIIEDNFYIIIKYIKMSYYSVGKLSDDFSFGRERGIGTVNPYGTTNEYFSLYGFKFYTGMGIVPLFILFVLYFLSVGSTKIGDMIAFFLPGGLGFFILFMIYIVYLISEEL